MEKFIKVLERDPLSGKEEPVTVKEDPRLKINIVVSNF